MSQPYNDDELREESSQRHGNYNDEEPKDRRYRSESNIPPMNERFVYNSDAPFVSHYTETTHYYEPRENDGYDTTREYDSTDNVNNRETIINHSTHNDSENFNHQNAFMNPNASRSRSKNMGAGLIASIAGLSAILGGLLGGAIMNSYDDSHNNGTSVTQQNITQHVTGGVNWTSTAKTVSPSVVTIAVNGSTSSGEGSGVILDTDGDIVTNNHVVSVAGTDGTIQVSIGSNVYSARIVGTDEASDIAVIKLKSKPSTPLVPIKFANSSQVIVGDNVMAVGSPLGLSGTATTGIVSALKRPVITQNASNSSFVVTNAIQTSAPINPGNSGGALVNANGELVGINSSIASLSNGTSTGDGSSGQTTESGSIGIGFAIPSNQVKNITNQILKTGSAEHAYLGITPDAEVVSVGRSADSGTLAVKIAKVDSGSAAAKAGLKVGDVITEFDGNPITSREELIASVRELNPGDSATLKVGSAGGSNLHDVKLTLGKAAQ